MKKYFYLTMMYHGRKIHAGKFEDTAENRKMIESQFHYTVNNKPSREYLLMGSKGVKNARQQ
jgi:hypothetical protein